MPTVADLGKLVKQKYPQYATIDDAELGRRVKAKHPQYSRFEDTPGFGERMAQTAAGMAKGAGQTLQSMGSLLTRGQEESFSPGGSSGVSQRIAKSPMVNPSNPSQQAGYVGETVAEWAIPATDAAKVGFKAYRALRAMRASEVGPYARFLMTLSSDGRKLLQQMKEPHRAPVAAPPIGRMRSVAKTRARKWVPTPPVHNDEILKVLRSNAERVKLSPKDLKVFADPNNPQAEKFWQAVAEEAKTSVPDQSSRDAILKELEKSAPKEAPSHIELRTRVRSMSKRRS